MKNNSRRRMNMNNSIHKPSKSKIDFRTIKRAINSYIMKMMDEGHPQEEIEVVIRIGDYIDQNFGG